MKVLGDLNSVFYFFEDFMLGKIYYFVLWGLRVLNV